MLHHVLERTNVSKEFIASIIGLQEFATWEQTTLAVTRSQSMLIPVTLIMEATRSSETSVFTRATRRHIPEDSIPRSHCHENLK
jgi:hypothetical protein